MAPTDSCCEDCGEWLGDAAYCTSCGAPAPSRLTAASCAACGVGLEPRSGFCTNCGHRVVPSASRGAGAASAATADRRGSALSFVLGIGAVVLLLGAGWLFLDRSSGSENQRVGDATADGSLPGGAEVDLGSQDDGVGTSGADGEATTTTGTAPTSASTAAESTIPATTALFASKDVVYGRYVAVLWSDFVSVTSSTSIDPLLEAELTSYRARFGSSVIAVDSNQFRSLRDGTAGVVYDGGFTSARDAKRWCRDSGFPGIQDCFGVVLSDDFSPDQRGDFIRAYEL